MATIHDVARGAGVSIATVSRVFNGSPRVSDATRRRVRSVSTRLDYWPNVAARSLTTSRAHALGILLPDLYGEFFSEVIRGIDHGARREKYQVLISSSHADTGTLLSAARSMRGRIDGLVAMAPDKGSTSAIEQIARSFPVVLLNPRVPVAGTSTVSVSNAEGVHDVVKHLVALGHRDIAMIKGPAGNVDAEKRLRGYRQTLREAGIDVGPGRELDGDFTEASGYAAAADLLRLRPRPTAVFAANDYMAIGLLSALHEAGVEVPNELAVAGFDDIAIAQYVSPPLTTVHVDAYELGERAIRLCLAAMRSADAATRQHEKLPATLVVRRSCGANGTRSAVERNRRRRLGTAPIAAKPATRTRPVTRDKEMR